MIDMAKIQIKSERLTPFGGLFSIGLRCRSFGYQYSEIIRSLMSIYFCGGSCIEDVNTLYVVKQKCTTANIVICSDI